MSTILLLAGPFVLIACTLADQSPGPSSRTGLCCPPSAHRVQVSRIIDGDTCGQAKRPHGTALGPYSRGHQG